MTKSDSRCVAEPALLCRAHARSSRGSPQAPITGRVMAGRLGWAVICQVLTASGKPPGAILASITAPVSVPQGGPFSYACGSVIYYASLADPFPEKGGELATVSRSENSGLSWSAPVVATSTAQPGRFVDHEWVAVDHTIGGPHFGRGYRNWALHCNNCSGNGKVKLYVAHSEDEGQTWSNAVQVSSTNNNFSQGFRETGQIAVASDGTVEAFWTENADSTKLPSLQVVATSTDGTNTFPDPIPLAQVADSPLTGTPFDAVDLFNRVPRMSARVDCYPHPTADPSSSRVYVVWCDFSGGHGVVKAAVSRDGLNWTALRTIADVAT